MIIEQTLIVKLTKRNKKHYKEKGYKVDTSEVLVDVKDMISGKNCSPMHPSCRCTSVIYYEDEDDENSTRFARDKNGKRIEIPSNMTFNEWKKKYID